MRLDRVLRTTTPARQPDNPRDRAIATGATTFIGKPCSRCGRRKRYTRHRGCKHCADQVARGFREFPNYDSETNT
jgi:hypothetical protein